MNVKMPRELEVMQEALEILEEHMEPSKLALLLSMLQVGREDYLAIREQLFAGETLTTLYEKVRAHRESQEQS